MSFQTWHTYGYGVCVDDISGFTVEKLQKLLSLAPKYEANINEWLQKNEIDNPILEDYYEYDEDWCLGLATLLKEVILEADGIDLTACNDFDDNRYLIYEPTYPWGRSERDKAMTRERLDEIFTRYIAILTDEIPQIDYQSVENGG